jgi:hypothetical protein
MTIDEPTTSPPSSAGHNRRVHMIEGNIPAPLPRRRIVHTWWPLAASWLLMAAESPAVSAVVARLAEPEINLAAFGGLVWPLALIIESPILMLLSASTALSRDRASYLRLRRFAMWAGAVLTALHVLIAFTPLYSFVVVQLIGAPAEIVEPARVGLMIMTPWTWAIGYRRFNQGVLIRFGHSRAVGLGTLVRLSVDGLALAAGYLIGTIPGIFVATGALVVGVTSEAIYAGLRVRPVVRDQLGQAVPVERPLTRHTFLQFYVPLAMTSMLNLLAEPLISAALSRMPNALQSLAGWSVVNGFVFLLRSLGYAYNEVVIALLEEPRAAHNLRRFTATLTALTTGLLLIIAATPLAAFWFGHVSALNPRLATLARSGLWIALPLPGLNALQSWYQGMIVHSRRTRGITEAIAIYVLSSGAMLWAGAAWGRATGLYVGLAAVGVGRLAQTVWLWRRSRPAMRAVQARDASGVPRQMAGVSAR